MPDDNGPDPRLGGLLVLIVLIIIAVLIALQTGMQFFGPRGW